MTNTTAIILTMNEEKNLEDCILSIVDTVKRIIVVDSGSTDNTEKIANKYGVDFYYHKFIHYADQFNWALDNLNIDTEWVLRIDADERLTPGISKEIEFALTNNNDNVTGYIFKLRVYFLNKWIKHGGVYPFRKLMLFKKGIGRLENRKKDAHTILSLGDSIELKNDALHYDFKNLTDWVNKHNWYATRETQDYFEKGFEIEKDLNNKRILRRRKLKANFYYRLPIFIRSWLYYIYRYYFLFGFLDGKEGRVFHFLQAYWYRFLCDAKIYEQISTRNKPEELAELK